MKKVLLIQPPLEDFYTTPIRLYPLGLLYVASVMEKLGFLVEILDCLSPLRKKILPLPEKFAYLRSYLGQPGFFRYYQRFGLPLEKILEKVEAAGPDLIGLNSSFAAYFSTVKELVEALTEKYHIPIVIGGNQATCCQEEVRLKLPGVEIFSGLAEFGLPKLLQESFGGESFLEAPAEELEWKKLWPAHHLLRPEAYRIGKKNYISLQSSRGCPHRCSFCNISLVFGSRVDYRPVSSVLKEMRWNYLNREVRLFNFEDDNLSYDRNWFEDFLKAVASDEVLQGCELTFMNGLSYENLDENLLALMKQAGVRKLDLSWVSGNPALRERHHRPQKKDEAAFFSLLKAARKKGFFVTVYLILGLPGQTKEEIIETTEKLLESGVLVGPSVFYLTPGSQLHLNLNLPAEIRNDWDLYRSTAFAVETAELTRRDLIELFLYIRKRNLERKG